MRKLTQLHYAIKHSTHPSFNFTHTHTQIKQLWPKPELTKHDKDSEIVQNMNPRLSITNSISKATKLNRLKRNWELECIAKH